MGAPRIFLSSLLCFRSQIGSYKLKNGYLTVHMHMHCSKIGLKHIQVGLSFSQNFHNASLELQCLEQNTLQGRPRRPQGYGNLEQNSVRRRGLFLISKRKEAESRRAKIDLPNSRFQPQLLLAFLSPFSLLSLSSFSLLFSLSPSLSFSL